MRDQIRARALSKLLLDRRNELRRDPAAPAEKVDVLRSAESELVELLASISQSHAAAMREREVGSLIFEVVPVGLVVIDSAGVVCEANPAADALARQRLLGKRFVDVFASERDAKLLLLGEHAELVEMTPIGVEGQSRGVQISSHPILDRSGRRLLVLRSAENREVVAPAREAHLSHRASRSDWGHVLVVDDDPDVRSMLARRLVESGARVDAAENGLAALRLLDAARPDVIVCDITMPEMDGYQFIRRVREQRCEVPAVALTGLSGDADLTRASEAGFDIHLTKPLDFRVLLRCIRQLVGADGSSRVA